MATICRKHKLLFIMVPGTGCSSIGRVLRKKFGGEFIPKVPLCQNGRLVLDHKHNSIRELVKYGYLSRVELSIYLKFGTVRNPFDSLVTEYKRFTGEWAENLFLKLQASQLNQNISEDEKIHAQISMEALRRKVEQTKSKSFEEWLEDYFLKGVRKRSPSLSDKMKNKVKFLMISNYYPKMSPLIAGLDDIIRYESLEEDFNMILKKSGMINPNEWVSIPKNNITPGKRNYRDYYTPTTRKLVEENLEKELKVFGYSF